MSEPIQPTAEPNVGEPSVPAESDNPVDSLMSRLQAHFAREEQGDTGDATPEPEPEPEKPAKADAPTEPEKGKGDPEPEKPKPAKGDEDPKEDLARARDRAELRRAQGELVKVKAEAEQAARKVAEIESLAKNNPVKLIEKLSGLTFQQFMERTAKGDFDDRAGLPPEVQEKLRLVDEWQAERERMQREAEESRQREESEAQRKAARVADRPKVTALIDESSHPLLASQEDSADMVLDIAYEILDRGERPNVREIIDGLERSAGERMTAYLTNQKLVKALVTKEPIRAILSEALGLKQQQSAGPASSHQGDPSKTTRTSPRSVASLNEVPSRSDRELTEAEERAEAARALRAWMDAQGQ